MFVQSYRDYIPIEIVRDALSRQSPDGYLISNFLWDVCSVRRNKIVFKKTPSLRQESDPNSLRLLPFLEVLRTLDVCAQGFRRDSIQVGYFTRNFGYFSQRGIKGPRPLVGVGNLWEMLFTSTHELVAQRYEKYGKIYGIFEGNRPVLQVGDPELIKQILVKDFDKFVDRRADLKAKHPIIDRLMANTRGDDWRQIRATVSPSFSSAKMRKMYPLMTQSLEELLDVLDTYAKQRADIDGTDVFGCFTMDVIASCAFATKTNAHKDPNDPFVKHGKQVLNVSFLTVLGLDLFPAYVLTMLNIKSRFNELAIQFFFDKVRQVIKTRQNCGQKYNDFIDLMMTAAKGRDSRQYENDIHEAHHEGLAAEKALWDTMPTNKWLTENEMLAQGFLFFGAGYQSTASLMAFCAYELAVNARIQERLHEEVVSSDTTNGEIDYNLLARLPYLDAVLAETLRLHSPLPKLTRVASEDYQLGDTGITVQKGQSLDIPIYGIHYSEEYYPNAGAFIPERFLPENRHNMTPYTYLPFGAGPRNCIGMRFALMETKLALFHMSRRFRFVRTSRTQVPLTLSKFAQAKFVKSLIIGIESRDLFAK
ncbi:unnamed protein product [Oppiella nova]|uniref:Cytochrome P450 n=1 Tax=Oppiella nova TaxID=334625 RepID=A0A7R9M4Y7_9ACAR|nr:unnamed protein product [Oppiella nova]CAG2170837.1 unnamed protein product [Oppiella nova]